MNSILVRHKWEPYVWLLPSILLMTIFVVFPIGIVFKLAFSEISKAGIVGGFIGFNNFKASYIISCNTIFNSSHTTSICRDVSTD